MLLLLGCFSAVTDFTKPSATFENRWQNNWCGFCKECQEVSYKSLIFHSLIKSCPNGAKAKISIAPSLYHFPLFRSTAFLWREVLLLVAYCDLSACGTPFFWEGRRATEVRQFGERSDKSCLEFSGLEVRHHCFSVTCCVGKRSAMSTFGANYKVRLVCFSPVMLPVNHENCSYVPGICCFPMAIVSVLSLLLAQRLLQLSGHPLR